MNPQTSLNQTPNDPQLADLMDQLKREIMLELCSTHVGTIQNFNSSLQTVQATINYAQTFFMLNDVTGVYAPVLRNYPLLIDCPCIVLGGGSSWINTPIQAGDECLLLFNDRDIDSWFQSGQFGAVATGRTHSFSDAFALVGVKSAPNARPLYDAVRMMFTNGSVKVGINPTNNKATIQNNITTLNQTLQDLCTQLETLTTALAALTVSGVTSGPGISGVPVNAAAISAVGTQIQVIALKIGGLLE